MIWVYSRSLLSINRIFLNMGSTVLKTLYVQIGSSPVSASLRSDSRVGQLISKASLAISSAISESTTDISLSQFRIPATMLDLMQLIADSSTYSYSQSPILDCFPVLSSLSYAQRLKQSHTSYILARLVLIKSTAACLVVSYASELPMNSKIYFATDSSSLVFISLWVARHQSIDLPWFLMSLLEDWLSMKICSIDILSNY